MLDLENFKKNNLYRELKDIDQDACSIVYKGNKYLNFSSNDYLGIGSRIDLQSRFIKDQSSINQFFMGSLSSRLLTGNSSTFTQLEEFIANLYKRESCLLFNSGYHANTGMLPAIVGKNDLLLIDKLVHASIIDCLSLAKCKWMRFKHNDYDDLECKLEKYRCDYKRVFIVTESIFSMDGDCADLVQLIKLKKKYDALLYVDEAHSVGVRGENGLGLSEELNLINDIDLIVCTLGKAIASEGAYLICNEDVKQYLVNTCRSLIFTTALPPITIRWTRFIFEEVIQMKKERSDLHTLTVFFRKELSEKQLLGNTHIIPFLIGNNTDCLKYSQYLQDNGIWGAPVRYPTVPLNQSRIRFSMNAAFSKEQISEVVKILNLKNL